MPEYIWQFICQPLEDGVYCFSEGEVAVSNGWPRWCPFDNEEDESNDL